MNVCPKGHQSQAADYCDECGAAISGGRSTSSSGTASRTSPPATTASGATCPDCGSPQAGRFCEVCGYDFIVAKLGGLVGPRAPTESPTASATSAPGTSPASPSTATLDGTSVSATPDGAATVAPAPSGAPAEASAPDPSAAAVPPVDPATREASDAGPNAAAPTNGAGSTNGTSVPDPARLPQRTPANAGWVLVVDADADYHARMQAQAEPDAEPISFPPFVPPRRFVLSGTRVLIGRRSRSRGIEPEIDLSGPPSDSAVSHAHALLLAGPDGSWAVVDLESANGTYVNDGLDPIPPNAPCQLTDGDRIHVGAWTTITLGHPV